MEALTGLIKALAELWGVGIVYLVVRQWLARTPPFSSPPSVPSLPRPPEVAKDRLPPPRPKRVRSGRIDENGRPSATSRRAS